MITDTLTILIADDHPVFRDGLRVLLESVEGFEVLAEASSGQEAIALCTELQPDVTLMDIQMPGMSGLEATRRIKIQNPQAHILMLTMFQDDDSVFAAIRAGANGYLLKGTQQAEILRVIRGVASGEAVFGAGVAQRVMQYFAAARPSIKAVFPELTAREREILTLIAQKSSNAEIARKLGLSNKTVRNYVSNIIGKLQVADRTEAILTAWDAGIGRELGSVE